MSIRLATTDDRQERIDELRSEVRAGYSDGASVLILETLLSIEAVLHRLESRLESADQKVETAKVERAKTTAQKQRQRGRTKPTPKLKLG